ncbi:MAG: SGNH/GDSL hydrolase family protein [Gordonia amarae]
MLRPFRNQIRATLVAATALATAAVVTTGVVIAENSTPEVKAVSNSQESPRVYVALGSSYAAGPGARSLVIGPCLRTKNNYPNQVAETLGMKLIDATCSGATTRNILDVPQRAFGGRPQIDEVPADADVITITTGGNDLGYVSRLILSGCGNVLPEFLKKTPIRSCRLGKDPFPEPQRSAYLEVERSMVAVIEAVRLRAPNAKILLVDYPPVVEPGKPTCAHLPLLPDQVAQTVRIFNGLADATARAAQTTGVTLVEASRAGAQHTVCSPTPWLTGFSPPVPYHPSEAGKKGVAELVVDALRPSRAQHASTRRSGA